MGRRHRRRGPQRPRLRGVSGEGRAESPRPRTSADRWRGVHHGGGLPWGQVLAARVFRGLVAAGDHPGPRPRALRLRDTCLRSTILPPVSERRIDSPLERPQTERPGTRALLEERRRGLSQVRGVLDRGHGTHRGDGPRIPASVAGFARDVQGRRSRRAGEATPVAECLGPPRRVLRVRGSQSDARHRDDDRPPRGAEDAGHRSHARPHVAPRNQRRQADVRILERRHGRHLPSAREGGRAPRGHHPHGRDGPADPDERRASDRCGTRGWKAGDGSRDPRKRGREDDVREARRSERAGSGVPCAGPLIKATGVVTKVNCLLGELPEFTARPGKTVQSHHKGYLDICPSVDYLERAWDDAKWGEPSKEPFLDCVLHSVMDPSLAPPGKFTLSIYSQYSPYHLRKGDWDDRKESVGDTILETLARFAPNVPHAVEAREVISPLDMEREWGLPGGCIYQTDMTPDQLFSFRPLPGWSGYRTPVRGLYLCGSSAHPGGGVTGAPGRNAAMVVLDDFAGLRS